MYLSRIIFANILIFIANFIFLFSLIPQIILNHKIRSTKGLSDIFILASLNGQFSYLIYAFTTNLPLIYRLINPIYAFLLLIIIFQRFYYSDQKKHICYDKKILKVYSINIIFLIYVSYLIFSGVTSLGYLIGWVPVGIGLWKKFPQILKVHRAKSVYGFSFFFILFSLFSYVCETVAAILLKLPVQVLMNDLRGLFINLVFIIQFWLYSQKS